MSDPTYPARLYLPKHRRSLAMHERIADKIRQDPSLLDKARATMDRWMAIKSADKSEPYYITEWRTLFDQGVEATLAFMVDLGEHATQLRQSSPFAGILSEQERLDFLAEWREKHPR